MYIVPDQINTWISTSALFKEAALMCKGEHPSQPTTDILPEAFKPCTVCIDAWSGTGYEIRADLLIDDMPSLGPAHYFPKTHITRHVLQAFNV